MATTPRPHGRVGARHQAKLKKWSDKVAREEDGQVAPSFVERPAVRRRKPLDAAKRKLRKLFQ